LLKTIHFQLGIMENMHKLGISLWINQPGIKISIIFASFATGWHGPVSVLPNEQIEHASALIAFALRTPPAPIIAASSGSKMRISQPTWL